MTKQVNIDVAGMNIEAHDLRRRHHRARHVQRRADRHGFLRLALRHPLLGNQRDRIWPVPAAASDRRPTTPRKKCSKATATEVARHCRRQSQVELELSRNALRGKSSEGLTSRT